MLKIYLRQVLCLSLFTLLFTNNLFAQNATQTIRGTVVDRVSHQAIIGATLQVVGTTLGTTSDTLGNFNIPNVPLGRRSVQCSYLGYETFVSEELILNSVKEIVLSIELSEISGELQTVQIIGTPRTSRPVNDVAYVSARSFSVEETERIPASVNDPGRMALSFPGVKGGRDEVENKIIVRGNSPYGILWRLEGIDLQNPNHFAEPGSSGGGITVFSAQLLSRSDFYTGGMPAEYGNSLTGAFDMHFREGNKEKREYRAKVGIIGMDFSTEGPIKKGQSSYLVNYRYSTLGLLNQLGFHLIGARITNLFQDLSFNLAFHSKNQKHTTTIFGIGGLSSEAYDPVYPATSRVYGRPDEWEDRLLPANMGAVGVTHSINLNEKSSLKCVVALSDNYKQRRGDTLDLQNIKFRYEYLKYNEMRLSGTVIYDYKFNNQTRLKSGIILNYNHFNLYNKNTNRISNVDITRLNRNKNIFMDINGSTQMVQAYTQLIQSIGHRVTVNAGLHYLHLLLNNTYSLQPRLSVRYRSPLQHTLSFSYGLYTQALPTNMYFYTHRDTVGGIITETQPNKNLELPRSHHFILSYNYLSPGLWRFTAETYFQRLTHVPVSTISSYYMLNYSENYLDEPVVSNGTGTNYGLDLAVEKSFAKQYFMLITASIFDAKFTTFSGKTYNSAFNDKFSTALTLSKEFTFKKGNTLQLGVKVIYSGGAPYTPNDPIKSAQLGYYVPLAGADNTLKARNYFRCDTRIAYRTNHKKFASVLSLDIQNISNTMNIKSMAYNSTTNSIEEHLTGSGLVPILAYQIDF